MKLFTGLMILVIILVAVTGCTQQAKLAPVASAAPSEEPTPAPTAVKTVKPTIVMTEEPAVVSTKVTITQQPSTTPQTKITTIHITNNTFDPAELTVLPHTGITWVNDDHVVHTIKSTGAGGTGKFTSSEIIPGASFTNTFGETEGTYEITSPDTPGMKGVIIIKKGESILGAPPLQITKSPAS